MKRKEGESHSASRGFLKQLYVDYRYALFNYKYYAIRLDDYKKLHMVLEIILLVGTSGAMGAWAIWKTSVGQYAWGMLVAMGVFLGIVKPYLQLPKHIERCSKLWVGYSDLYFDLGRLVLEIQVRQAIAPGIVEAHLAMSERFKRLALDQDLRPKKKLQRMCFQEVRKEIPEESLWVPAEIDSNSTDSVE
jgi:hypothetical protein